MSLPFFHPYLHDIVKFKRDKKKKIEAFLQQEKHKLIQMEKFAMEKKQQNFNLQGVLCSKSQHFLTSAREREALKIK